MYTLCLEDTAWTTLKSHKGGLLVASVSLYVIRVSQESVRSFTCISLGIIWDYLGDLIIDRSCLFSQPILPHPSPVSRVHVFIQLVGKQQ